MALPCCLRLSREHLLTQRRKNYVRTEKARRIGVRRALMVSWMTDESFQVVGIRQAGNIWAIVLSP